MLRTVACVCLLAVLALLLPNANGASYMTPMGILNTTVALTTLNENIYDVWADEASDTFLFRFAATVWRTNYARTVVQSWCNDSTGACGYGYGGWIDDLASSDGFVFNSYAGKIYRFNVTDVSTPTVLDVTENQGNSVQMAVDKNRKLGFTVHYDLDIVVVIDLVAMTVKSSFNYTDQSWFVDVINTNGGGFAPVYDNDRNVLWLATNCESPTPGQIWQFDMTDTENPVLRNRVYYPSGACFERGFVETGTGNVWYAEDDAAMLIRFAYEDLSWSSDYWVATADYVETFEFDAANNQAFWIDFRRSGEWAGGVYRHCVYEAGSPANVHEVVNYATLSGGNTISPDQSFFDSAAGVLYIIDDNTVGVPPRIYTVEIAAGTDCSQTPSPTSATSGSSPASTLRSMWSFLF